MPARPFVANVAQIVVSGNIDGVHNWVNKMFVRYSGAAPVTVDLNSYAAGLTAAWVANLTPLQNSVVVLKEIEVTDLASDLGEVGIDSGTVAGSRAGAIIPGGSCALISNKIARHYRGGHPRTYLCVGSQPDLLSPATWTSAFVTAVEAAWAAWQAALIVAYGAFTPSEVANVSYVTAKAARLVPQVDQVLVAGTTCSAELASQRRRIGRK
jgi:hypothetical protein